MKFWPQRRHNNFKEKSCWSVRIFLSWMAAFFFCLHNLCQVSSLHSYLKFSGGTFSIRSSTLQFSARARRSSVSACALLMSFCRCSYCWMVRTGTSACPASSDWLNDLFLYCTASESEWKAPSSFCTKFEDKILYHKICKNRVSGVILPFLSEFCYRSATNLLQTTEKGASYTFHYQYAKVNSFHFCISKIT